MRIVIPFINTRVETDIALVLIFMPLWWVSGLGVFIYHLAAFWVFVKQLAICIQRDKLLRIPKVFLCFFIFLISYLISILVNAPQNPVQRVFASLNNFSMLVMGGFLLLTVYNADASHFFQNLFKACRWSSIVAGFLGVSFLVLWLLGYKSLEFPTLICRWAPSLLDYPYFNMMLLMTTTMSDWLAGIEIPRITLYSIVPTATGGLMLILTPMMMAYYEHQPGKKVEYGAVFLLSILVLSFSLSRAAIYGFLSAFLLVTILEKGKKIVFAFICFAAALMASGIAHKTIDWILDVRKPSTVGRFELYEEAFRIVMDQNPLFGVGIRIREDFTFMAIGSHALYIEIMFVAGFVGLTLLLLFQAFVMLHWHSQKNFLKQRSEKIIWKYLGLGLFGLNIWLVTDTLLALPFIPFGYFLITGGIFLLGRTLKESRLKESRLKESNALDSTLAFR